MKNKLLCFFFVLVLMPVNNSIADTAIDIQVKKIVHDRESNDTKIYKIEAWVRKNMTYLPDKVQFNMDDRWTLPMETLQRRKGDCEDGSILIMAFASTAGISRRRLRLYAPISTSEGYHASVAYKRESDEQWVWVEWTSSKYISLGPIDRRPTTDFTTNFLPLGNYLEVTNLNPYRMKWFIDQKWESRSKALLGK